MPTVTRERKVKASERSAEGVETAFGELACQWFAGLIPEVLAWSWDFREGNSTAIGEAEEADSQHLRSGKDGLQKHTHPKRCSQFASEETAMDALLHHELGQKLQLSPGMQEFRAMHPCRPKQVLNALTSIQRCHKYSPGILLYFSLHD